MENIHLSLTKFMEINAIEATFWTDMQLHTCSFKTSGLTGLSPAFRIESFQYLRRIQDKKHMHYKKLDIEGIYQIAKKKKQPKKVSPSNFTLHISIFNLLNDNDAFTCRFFKPVGRICPYLVSKGCPAIPAREDV